MRYVDLDIAIEIVKWCCISTEDAKDIIQLLTTASQNFIPAIPPKATIRDDEDWDWAVFH